MSESTHKSGSINFAGLGNGTDFNKLIQGMVDIEKTRVTRLKNWKASWELKNGYFKDLNTKMLTLKTSLEGLDTMAEFMTKAASSANSNVLTATANADAIEASHMVEVGQLAQNDVLITTSGASALDTSITSADTSFTFSYAGKSYTIDNISAGTTLDGFVKIINNHPDSRGKIQASTIFDGSVHHLQLTGVDQGAKNQVIISNAGTLVFGAGDFTKTRSAQNAQIRVNDFPAGGKWIERPTNVIDDAITGVTLNLKSVAPGSKVSLTVSTDDQAIIDNVTKFVDAINTVRSQIIHITKVDKTKGTVKTGGDSLTTEKKGSALTGNYGIDIISQRLKDITADVGAGFEHWDKNTLTGDKYSALSQLGIMTDAEEGSPSYGLLTVDHEKLKKAIDNDPNAVTRLFSLQARGESNSADFTVKSIITKTTRAGNYDVQITSDGTKITSAFIDGKKAKISGWEITAKEGDAIGMSIRLDNTGPGTYSGKASVKMGKTGELVTELEALTKPFNKLTHQGGPLAVLQNNYNDIMASIDDKIKYENDRIDKMEKNLRLKYARLDALLGQYQLRQGQLSSAIKKLE